MYPEKMRVPPLGGQIFQMALKVSDKVSQTHKQVTVLNFRMNNLKIIEVKNNKNATFFGPFKRSAL